MNILKLKKKNIINKDELHILNWYELPKEKQIQIIYYLENKDCLIKIN
jgi:hypothetical protein